MPRTAMVKIDPKDYKKVATLDEKLVNNF